MSKKNNDPSTRFSIDFSLENGIVKAVVKHTQNGVTQIVTHEFPLPKHEESEDLNENDLPDDVA